MVVLQHKAGDTSVDVYMGAIGSKNCVSSTLVKTTISVTQAPLALGAAKAPAGTISNYGTGFIYKCIL